MAATKVTRLWAAFVVVIVKVLAALGFRTPATGTGTATAATTAPVAAPAPVPAETGDGRAALPVETDTGEPVGARGRGAEDVPAFALPRMRYGRILPPTMKQRIRAEAHGAAPSSRSVPVELSDAPYTGPVGAPPARPVSAPPARAVSVPQARRPERERQLCPA
ncbi:DUF6344 domain-containing protein [Streptomyces sp. NRRL F-5755]|uniref:DUF6344 domain-containing protein n=1 Tax=Streptomyces sp. NRRL F-5755 TaxID=1519475 RepID=UPI0006AE5156|nr:DUF6344 domain-containing protein [Streptomyces sp. NRRL F-5755]